MGDVANGAGRTHKSPLILSKYSKNLESKMKCEYRATENFGLSVLIPAQKLSEEYLSRKSAVYSCTVYWILSGHLAYKTGHGAESHFKICVPCQMVSARLHFKCLCAYDQHEV